MQRGEPSLTTAALLPGSDRRAVVGAGAGWSPERRYEQGETAWWMREPRRVATEPIEDPVARLADDPPEPSGRRSNRVPFDAQECARSALGVKGQVEQTGPAQGRARVRQGPDDYFGRDAFSRPAPERGGDGRWSTCTRTGGTWSAGSCCGRNRGRGGCGGCRGSARLGYLDRPRRPRRGVRLAHRTIRAMEDHPPDGHQRPDHGRQGSSCGGAGRSRSEP